MVKRKGELVVFAFILLAVALFCTDLMASTEQFPGAADAARFGLPLSLMGLVAFYVHCKRSM